MSMKNSECPVCGGFMKPGMAVWHFVCDMCKYEKGTHNPGINDESMNQFIDESFREIGLQPLRIKNFKKLILDLEKLKPNGGDLLDVGAAHGWFLDLAKYHFKASGVEPDFCVYNATSARTSNIRLGYFPDALNLNEKFDIIAFNDVFEHIPDVNENLENCKKFLNENGILLLNLPSSTGFFYNLSRFFARIGFPAFFERLWQVGMPSPHLHYFNLNNLNMLLEKQGFIAQKKGVLDSISLKSLYKRIRLSNDVGVISASAIYLIILIFYPFIKLFPSDIIYIMAKKS